MKGFRDSLEKQGAERYSNIAMALVASVALHVLAIGVAAEGAVFGSGVKEQKKGGVMLAVLLPSSLSNEAMRSVPTPVFPLEAAANVSAIGVGEAEIGNDPVSSAARKYDGFGILTKQAYPLTDIDLNIPEIADSAVQAKLVLRLSINASGDVTKAMVRSADGANSESIWVKRVLDRFRMARFAPGEIQGMPVSCEIEITVIVE